MRLRLAAFAFALAGFAGGAFAQLGVPSYQGLWWRAPANSESGWGLNITHQGSILFATWFTYDENGDGMWLVLPNAGYVPSGEDPYYGGGSGAAEYRGALYRTTGPAFSAATFDPDAVTVSVVGFATLRFTSANLGSFTYTVNGVTQTKAITRQVFATMPVCDFDGAATSNYQALWWRAPAGSESGWGVNITHQGEILFATWFTYDAQGDGLWLVMPDGRRAGAGETWSGTLYRTRGPAFDAVPWNPAEVVVTPVGSATFAFTGPDSGTFTYTVEGATQSKPIARQLYASPATSCHAAP